MLYPLNLWFYIGVAVDGRQAKASLLNFQKQIDQSIGYNPMREARQNIARSVVLELITQPA